MTCSEIISFVIEKFTVEHITAAIALVALVMLYCQLRAANKQLKLQNYIEYTKRYQDIMLNFPENINEDDFDMSHLSDKKKNKTMRYMRAYYDLCYEESDLASKGFIDDEMWESWKNGMIVAFKKSAFQQAWKQIGKNTKHNDEFNEFVNMYVYDCKKCQQKQMSTK